MWGPTQDDAPTLQFWPRCRLRSGPVVEDPLLPHADCHGWLSQSRRDQHRDGVPGWSKRYLHSAQLAGTSLTAVAVWASELTSSACGASSRRAREDALVAVTSGSAVACTRACLIQPVALVLENPLACAAMPSTLDSIRRDVEARISKVRREIERLERAARALVGRPSASSDGRVRSSSAQLRHPRRAPPTASEGPPRTASRSEVRAAVRPTRRSPASSWPASRRSASPTRAEAARRGPERRRRRRTAKVTTAGLTSGSEAPGRCRGSAEGASQRPSKRGARRRSLRVEGAVSTRVLPSPFIPFVGEHPRVSRARASLASMLRRLFLLRHAKSSWDDPTLDDHNRPRPSGATRFQVMAAHLRRESIVPSLVLCSSTVRTRETLKRISAGFGNEVRVEVEPALYTASAGELLARLRQVDGSADSVMLIGHQPAIQDLALLLSHSGPEVGRIREKFPTGALATLEFEGAWEALAPGSADAIAFVKPRELERRPE